MSSLAYSWKVCVRGCAIVRPRFLFSPLLYTLFRGWFEITRRSDHCSMGRSRNSLMTKHRSLLCELSPKETNYKNPIATKTQRKRYSHAVILFPFLYFKQCSCSNTRFSSYLELLSSPAIAPRYLESNTYRLPVPACVLGA